PTPYKSTNDSQYTNWEYGVQKWWANNFMKYGIVSSKNIPTVYDQIHTENSKPVLTIIGLSPLPYKNGEDVSFVVNSLSLNPIKKIDVFINNTYLKSLKSTPFSVSFSPKEITGITNENTIRIVGYDVNDETGEATAVLKINN
ncbi:hypothetical protein HXX01_00090, partial [Candidatus Nomurabacteria bacterium]|nr:hypothetical protein [Candidatus Nomurabacteria bacterium]